VIDRERSTMVSLVQDKVALLLRQWPTGVLAATLQRYKRSPELNLAGFAQ